MLSDKEHRLAIIRAEELMDKELLGKLPVKEKEELEKLIIQINEFEDNLDMD